MAKTKMIISVEAETSKAVKSLDNVEKKLGEVEGAQKDVNSESKEMGASFGAAGGAINGMTGGAIAGFGGMVKGIKAGVMGLKSFKVALAATGIGLLVVAIGSLVAFFTKSRRGAEMLEKVTAGLGAVMGKVSDVVVGVGEGLVKAFTNPQEAMDSINTALSDLWDWFTSIGNYIKSGFNLNMLALQKTFKKAAIAVKEFFGGDASQLKSELAEINSEIVKTQTELQEHADAVTEPLVEMWEDVTDAVSGFVDELDEAFKAGQKLAERSIALREAQRELNVAFAEGRAQIRENQLISEDANRTIEERIEASEKAAEIEKSLVAERQRIAAEELAIHKANMALSESTEEDYDKLNELEVNLINIRTESARIQKSLLVKTQQLRKEEQAEIDRQDKEKLDKEAKKQAELKILADAQLTAEELELQKVKEKFDKLKTLAEKYGEDTTTLETKRLEAEAAIRKKFAKKEVVDEEINNKQMLQMAGQALGALTALNNAFAKDGEEGAKKAFKRNKALSMSTAIVNTALAVSDALAKDSVAPLSRYVSAAAAGAMGIAQVATIARTQFQSTTSPDTTEDLSGSIESTSQTGQAPPSIDFGFLGQGAGAEGGIRAYVIAENVSNGLQANQKLTDQTTL